METSRNAVPEHVLDALIGQLNIISAPNRSTKARPSQCSISVQMIRFVGETVSLCEINALVTSRIIGVEDNVFDASGSCILCHKVLVYKDLNYAGMNMRSYRI